MDKTKRIFFFDIDETIYDSGLRELQPSTDDALRLLFARGHVVYLNTSRAEPEMANVRHIVGRYPFHGVIYSGGPVVRRTGDGARCTFLKERDAALAIDFCARNGLLTRWQTAEGLYFNAPPPEGVKATLTKLFGAVPPVRTWAGEPLVRLAVYAPPEALRPLCCQAADLWCRPLSPKVSDLVRTGVSKGSAMLGEAEALGFSPKQTVAFGDGIVDLDMLRQAGVGVAMGDGDPEVRRQADYVTEPVSQGGILQACRHFGWI